MRKAIDQASGRLEELEKRKTEIETLIKEEYGTSDIEELSRIYESQEKELEGQLSTIDQQLAELGF